MNEATTKPFNWIIGGNLVLMVVYTLIFRIYNMESGIILTAFLIAIHLVVCLIIGIACMFMSQYEKFGAKWLLSALLVLLIGFSTCVATYTIKI